MRLPNFITKTEKFLTQSRKVAKTRRCKGLPFFANFATLHLCVFALIFFIPVAAQKVAILTPDKTDQSRVFAERLFGAFGKKITLLDADLASAAYNSTTLSNPFNMTTDESKEVGMVIGCEFFVLVRSVIQRRSASGRDDYYEAYAALYIVSTRTGRLIEWRLQKFEAIKPETSAKLLQESTTKLAADIEARIAAIAKAEISEPTPPEMEEPPDQNSPPNANFRSPVPYRRIKPEYTAEAALYDIAATVDILVDTDAAGSITRTEIVRWAGYGLDESVERAVRQMNWRPAERNGKTLPMRFLLRYNFKKLT